MRTGIASRERAAEFATETQARTSRDAGGPMSAEVTPRTTPAVTPQPRSELKEWVAAILSFALVGFTLYFLWVMFGGPAVDNEQWERKSAMLQIAVSFTGAVIGYYFGRLPAEKAAASAQQHANLASANENRLRSQVAEVRKQLSTPTGGGAGETPETYRLRVAHLLNTVVE